LRAPISALLIRLPVSLDLGKTSWHVFEARMNFLKESLYAMGHRSIAVYYYCWDRALFSSVGRIMLRYHHLLLEREVPAPLLPTALLMTWVVMAPCGAHDFHNSLRWGMLSFRESHFTVCLKTLGFLITCSLK
jgi:hypothetical protein